MRVGGVLKCFGIEAHGRLQLLLGAALEPQAADIQQNYQLCHSVVPSCSVACMFVCFLTWLLSMA